MGRHTVAKNVVYRVDCIDKAIDSKVYVGSTSGGLAKRKGDHLESVRKGYETNDMYISMRKNGIDKYNFVIVKGLDDGDKEITRAMLQKAEDEVATELRKAGITLYNIRAPRDPNRPLTASRKWRIDNSEKYVCHCCGLNTSNQQQMENHLITNKHRVNLIKIFQCEEFAMICYHYDDLVENANYCENKKRELRAEMKQMKLMRVPYQANLLSGIIA